MHLTLLERRWKVIKHLRHLWLVLHYYKVEQVTLSAEVKLWCFSGSPVSTASQEEQEKFYPGSLQGFLTTKFGVEHWGLPWNIWVFQLSVNRANVSPLWLRSWSRLSNDLRVAGSNPTPSRSVMSLVKTLNLKMVWQHHPLMCACVTERPLWRPQWSSCGVSLWDC